MEEKPDDNKVLNRK